MSGVVTGTVAVGASSGSPYTVTFTATDTVDIASVTQSVQWTVAASDSITVTVTQPDDQTNKAGDTPNLTVSASDSASNPVTFRRRRLAPRPQHRL